ncbi:MAG: hypothetical protein FJW98_07375 [Actinobacteria bacterium]|nr:hypothetical protein [Actinomycetota bacterium]
MQPKESTGSAISKSASSAGAMFGTFVFVVTMILGTSSNANASSSERVSQTAVVLSTSVSDLNLQLDLTRAISSSFRFESINCVVGRNSFPSISSIGTSIAAYPERWSGIRHLQCRPRVRLSPYTFTIFGQATSAEMKMSDGVVVSRCSFGTRATFRMALDIGTGVSDLVNLKV